MRRLWCRLRAALRRVLNGGPRDDELGEELRAFVELDAESKTRAGMTPADARRAALVEMGGAEQVKERVREAAAGVRLEGVVRDIRDALRSLGRAPGFSSSVIGNLSLGLAAMIVAFAFINGALGPSIIPGIQDQDRLVEIGILETNPRGMSRPAPTALADYPVVNRVLDEGMPSLEGLASFTVSDVAVTLPQPRSLRAAFVSSNYFDVLGVRPEIGRTFAPDEGGAASPVAIISRALWMREFGGDPSVIGRPIQVGGRQTFEVIGVATQGFTGTTRPGADLWLPIGFVNRVAVDDPFEQRGNRLIQYVGRMRAGVRVERVETELGVAAARLGVARPAGVPGPAQLVTSADAVERVTVEVSGLSGRRVDQLALMVAVILPVPLLVLALACVNAANLLLVRASGRSREVAVRLALGASRSRLVRQLIIESLVLAVGAAIVALPLAWSGVQLIAAFVMLPMPLDGTVVAGALVTAFLTALGFGLVPALHATRRHPSAALGTAPAGSGGTRAETRGRRALVAGQVALSLGLLAAAFQLTSPLESIAEAPDTDPERLLLASFDLAQLRFSSGESDAFYAALLDRASRLPGAEAAGVSSHDFARGWISDQVLVDTGDGPRDPSGRPFGFLVTASSAEGDFFKVLGLDLRQGREFVAADRRDIPQVAIVTEHFAAQVFGGAALGRSFRVSISLVGEAEAEVRIVGIVESPVERNIDNVRGPSIVEPSPSGEVAAIFFPSPLQNGTARTLSVRADGPAGFLAPAIREIVAQIDPRVPILELATLDQRIPDITQIIRGLARAAAVMGIVALLLASIGLYGVTSYGVEMRRREIAVRMALGAQADRVVAMVLRHALTVATIGAVLGGLMAIAAGTVIQAQLFGVPGVDVAALGGSATLLAAAMLVASILPARRAARLDPMAVLREA
ncbi:MAG: ABC transporter permease [Candidatus Rokuibacteriota bacterium]